jgi:hypothetical protein
MDRNECYKVSAAEGTGHRAVRCPTELAMCNKSFARSSTIKSEGETSGVEVINVRMLYVRMGIRH